ncbi:hypothetical protein CONPUDRAFT_142527, partial [Coniophora puteana RWD-64-598 SS2]
MNWPDLSDYIGKDFSAFPNSCEAANMRLQALVPHLPQDLVSAWAEIGIRTDTDLLFSGSAVDILSRLPEGSIRLAQLRDYIALVAQQSSSPAIRGDELLEQELAPSQISTFCLTAGVPEIDSLLETSERSLVYEISGDRGSGKSILALHLVLQQLVSNDVSALWMDTTGDFSVDRARHQLQYYSGEKSSSALARLEVATALNTDAAIEILESMRPRYSASPNSRLCCVVIDTITRLLGPNLSAASPQGHAIMASFMHHLRTLAREHELTFLVINDTASSFPKGNTPSTSGLAPRK